MKKMALVLALFMVIALAFGACAKTETAEPTSAPATTPAATAAPGASAAPATEAPAGPTEEELKNSKPDEYVQEKLAAGMEVLVACSMFADVPILMEVWGPQAEKVIKDAGMQWQISAANFDTAMQISQIENYVTMGAASIILVPPDALSEKDAVIKAGEAGTQCVIYGLEGVDYCFSVRNDVIKTGSALAHMAMAWGKQTFPDASADNPVKFCVEYDADVEDARRNGENVVVVINSDPTCKVMYSTDASKGSIDSGYTTMQNALTVDPGIRVYACIIGPPALGASNYVMAQPGLDYSKYACFGSSSDTAGMQAINELSPKNEAVLRGTVELQVQNGTALGQCALNGLFGVWKSPYEALMAGYCVTQPGFDFTEEFQ